MNAHTKGTCYLLHFDRPYKHAQHYLGWTIDLQGRLDEHLDGTGARLLEVITAEGIGFEVVRTWHGVTLADEKKLKAVGSGRRLCPKCSQKPKDPKVGDYGRRIQRQRHSSPGCAGNDSGESTSCPAHSGQEAAGSPDGVRGTTDPLGQSDKAST